MKIQMMATNDLIPYADNPRQNDDAVDAVASSIKDFGFKVPIVVDSQNEIVTGHTRLKAAKKLGLDEVPVIVADDLTPEQVKAFRLADNKTGELADWNEDLLEGELAKILNIDMSLYGFGGLPLEDSDIEDDTYTMKIDVPHYQITGVSPELVQLVNTEKVDELTSEIKKANIPDDIKKFLEIATTRHYKFDYASIAEYYAHADKEVQKLFEDSALVIIDFDDAIKDGYVKLSDRLMRMRKGEDNE